MDNLTRFDGPSVSSPVAYRPPVQPEPDRHGADYLRIARRRWIYIPAFTFGLAALALGVSLVQHKTYTSTAEVLIQSPASAASSSVSSSQYQAIASILGVGGGNDLATQIELMTSDNAMERVAKLNGMKDVVPGDLKKQFVIEPSKTSSEIINVTSFAGKPKQAADLVRSIVDVYNESMSQESSTAVGRMAAATQSEMTAIGAKLANAETERSEYSKRLGSIDPQSETSQKVGQLYTLRNELIEAQKSLAVAQAQLSYYNGQVKILDPSVVPNLSFQSNPRIDNDKAQLEQLEQQRVVLSSQYTPSDDQMINNQKQIDVIKQQIAAERAQESRNFAFTLSNSGGKATAPQGSYVVEGGTQELNPLREDARAKASAAQAEIDSDVVQQQTLQAALGAMKQDVQSTPDALRKMGDLSANIDVLRAIYTDLQTQDAQLQARLPAEQTYAKFLTYPLVPKKQIAPRPLLYSGLAGLFGLLIGCIIAVLVDNGDVRLRDTKDAETLFGTPVLMSFGGRKQLTVSLGADGELEPYRKLAITLGYLGLGRTFRSIIVTSAVRDEGTSEVASNLAVALSKEGRRVVLVDANLKKPVLHMMFGQKNNDGLAGLMRNGAMPDHALLPIGGSTSLSLIPSGDASEDATVLDTINPEKLAIILSDLREKADIVIIDAPAVFAGYETSIIADKVDSVLFVSRTGSAPRATVREAFDLLQNCSAKIIGTVVNGAKD